MKAMRAVEAYLKQSGLDHGLLHMIKLRASQMNGCAYCVDMHWRDLLRHDVDPRHANAVAAWREAPFFSERERAALHWAELVTAIPNRDPSDEAFAVLREHFSDEEIAELGFSIAVINAWNLLNVSFRNPVPARV